jgi:hypothetical protein
MLSRDRSTLGLLISGFRVRVPERPPRKSTAGVLRVGLRAGQSRARQAGGQRRRQVLPATAMDGPLQCRLATASCPGCGRRAVSPGSSVHRRCSGRTGTVARPYSSGRAGRGRRHGPGPSGPCGQGGRLGSHVRRDASGSQLQGHPSGSNVRAGRLGSNVHGGASGSHVRAGRSGPIVRSGLLGSDVHAGRPGSECTRQSLGFERAWLLAWERSPNPVGSFVPFRGRVRTCPGGVVPAAGKGAGGRVRACKILFCARTGWPGDPGGRGAAGWVRGSRRLSAGIGRRFRQRV